MDQTSFISIKGLSKNMLQSASIPSNIQSEAERYFQLNCQDKRAQNVQNVSGKISKQSSFLRNARTPPIIKMKITVGLDDKSYNFENFVNKSYVNHEELYKKKSKRAKTQQSVKNQTKNFYKINCFKSQSIRSNNSSKMMRATNITKQNIKKRKPQKSLDQPKYQNVKSVEKDVELANENQQIEFPELKVLTKRPIKLNKIPNNKIYLKFLNNTVKKRDSFLKQTSIRQQIKTFNELQALKKQYNEKLRNFTPPPIISANSYIIVQVLNNIHTHLNLIKKQKSEKNNKNVFINYQNFKILASYNFKLEHQVASLTKIMTCILVIQICQKNYIPMYESQFQITKFQHQIQGTSAKIKSGQIYTIQQLLYGLMLPSGNDASLALAVWAGNILLTEKFQLSSRIEIKHKKKQCLKRFVQQMNKKAAIMGMEKTKYSNPHGLNDLQNKSCAYDIVKLTNYCMKNQKFSQIVSCKQYTAYVKYIMKNNLEQQQTEIQENKSQIKSSQSTIDEKVQKPSFSFKKHSQNLLISELDGSKTNLKYRLVRWYNTHKLLNMKTNIYKGVKTGITSQAGACLSSFIQFQERTFIIVVLGCRSASHRFKQTQMLRKYIFRQQGLCKCGKNDKKCKEQVKDKGLAQNSTCCDFYYPDSQQEHQNQLQNPLLIDKSQQQNQCLSSKNID